MPIKRCTLPNGGSGYKYGDSGKCYASEKDAIRQMRAIKANEGKASFISQINDFLDPELAELNAIANSNITDDEIDSAVAGHGTWKYSCGHQLNCRCPHVNMVFHVKCQCANCRES